ncbi:alkaline phosphatase PhoX [Thiomicrorhabdus sp.]|uniref:PhoX family protein n=1 Tax=Thiomicrorhabdus sp. TaxID=2039724 RepID=UPI0029C76480|nr:alkaline phosphatase PhoX [Thiomicrorhabdus sp.]
MKLNRLHLALATATAGFSLVLTGCNTTDSTTDATAASNEIKFTELSAPSDEVQRNLIRATEAVTINDTDMQIGYTTLLRTGEVDNGETFGLAKDYQDQAIVEDDGSNYICNGTDDGVGSGLDHVSLLDKDGKIYMVSQFECSTGAMYMNELEKASDGSLSLVPGSLKFVSQKDGFGGWVHCAGMTTPWQSHLGSEEYEPDARNFENATYYKDVTKSYWQGDASKNNPYYYGWTPEVDIDANGNPVYTKHYSMGRMAHELGYVMPDEKTVYLTDDGTNVGLFMFVADTAKDLSAGTLYAAKWNQTADNEKGGEASLTWISLGHTTNAQIKNLLDPDGNVNTNDSGLTFASIFDAEDPVNGSCPTAGFTYTSANGTNECLKLKNTVDEAIAARLETRRVAAVKGATVEFRKEEGVTFNARDNQLYIAMSEIRKGMTDGAGDIQLTENKCGAVYSLDVEGAIKDTDGADIASEFVAVNMNGLIGGNYLSSADADGNTCDINGIAQPDNVTYIEGTDTLIIGEDTSAHNNDMIWAYNIKSDELTRIAHTPYGAETTSPYWYSIDGNGYITLTNQHPYGEGGPRSYNKPFGAEIRSEIGYVGPFDTSKMK